MESVQSDIQWLCIEEATLAAFVWCYILMLFGLHNSLDVWNYHINTQIAGTHVKHTGVFGS